MKILLSIEILNTLSKLKYIDKELWKKKIIWSTEFVKNIKLDKENNANHILRSLSEEIEIILKPKEKNILKEKLIG